MQLAANYAFVRFEHYAEEWQVSALLRKVSFEMQSNALVPSNWHSSASRDAESRPVVIIDISRLRRISPSGGNSAIWRNARGITPRGKLSELLTALAEFHPAAIGFDIDLSRPEEGEVWSEENMAEDRMLFDQALAFMNAEVKEYKQDYPQVYFGVGRRASQLLNTLATGSQSDSPFSDPKYSILGVLLHAKGEVYLGGTPSLVMLPKRMVFVPANSPRNAESTQAAEGLAERLSAAFKKYHGLPSVARFPRLLTPTMTHMHALSEGRGSTVTEDFFVNYSERVEEADILELENFLTQASNPDSGLRDRIKGRVVLVGAANRELTEDQVVIPGRGDTVPGVEAHASGVLTLLRSPLLIPRDGTSLAFGLLFSAITAWLFRVTIEKSRTVRRFFRTEESLELIKIPCSAVCVFGLISVLARLHIAWPGALAVLAGVLIESAVAIFVLNWIGQEKHVHPQAETPS